MRVTLKIIAAEAKVSVTCASQILNGKTSEYSEKTIRKVKKIAEEKNYIANTIARSMKTNSTMTIGLILPDITNPYYPELAKGIEATAYELGYNIIYINTDENIAKENEAFKILVERMVNGIVYIPSFDTSETEDVIAKCPVPIVMVDRSFRSKGISGTVSSNGYKGSKEATQYLINKGYKNILFLSGEKKSKTTSDRILGFIDTLEQYNILVNKEFIKEGDYTAEFGHDITLQFLDTHRCDAIFAASDLIAIGVLGALREKHIKVPEEIALIGYDDIYFSKYLTPALTTVEQPKFQMGVDAVKMLVNIIEKKEVENTHIVIDPTLIIRQSVR